MSAQVFTFPKAKKRGRKVLKGPTAEVHVLHRQEQEVTTEMVNRWHTIGYSLGREQRRARMEELAAEVRARSDAYHAWLDAQPYVIKFPASRRVRGACAEHQLNHAYKELMARKPDLTPEEGFRRAMKAQEVPGPLIA